jgi:hypothetical protein
MLHVYGEGVPEMGLALGAHVKELSTWVKEIPHMIKR